LFLWLSKLPLQQRKQNPEKVFTFICIRKNEYTKFKQNQKKKKRRLFMGVALLAHLHGCEAHRTHKVWLNREEEEEEEEDAEGERNWKPWS
jgi:hypothetical protein